MQNDTSLSHTADAYGRNVSSYFNIEDKQEKYQADKLYKRLRRKVGHAIGDYGMIEPGDKIVVAMSGGKDSYALLDILLSLKRFCAYSFYFDPSTCRSRLSKLSYLSFRRSLKESRS